MKQSYINGTRGPVHGFDASGTFNRTVGVVSGAPVWQGDAAAGTRIMADRHDSHDQDLANGLSECLTRTGKGTPSVDIPWGGKKIVNMNNPTAPQDAATKNYVDTLPGWTTSKNISGADLDGRLNFTGASGVNGITWSYANLAWVARHATTGEANDRLVLAPTVTPDTTGPAAGLTDVFIIDDTGHINNSTGVLSNNTSYEAAQARTIVPGTGTILTYTGGAFSVSSNDVDTITNNYASFTPRTFFNVDNDAGSTLLNLYKSASTKVAGIVGRTGTSRRWLMYLGDQTAESAPANGSDFQLYAYENDGATLSSAMKIDRSTLKVTFGGEVSSAAPQSILGPATAGSSFTLRRSVDSGSFHVYGGTAVELGAYLSLYGENHAANGNDIVLGANGSYRYFYDYSLARHFWANNSVSVMDLDFLGSLTIAGNFRFDGNLISTNTIAIVSTAVNGAIYFRPNGAASTADQVVIDTSGNLRMQDAVAAATGGVYAGKGIRSKAGETGAYSAYWLNLNWNGSTLAAYAGTSLIGNLTYSCDHRIKKDVQPLGSMWAAVKALKPIRYTQKAFEVWTEDNTERWGFMAHELQDSLGAGAATGVKDGKDVQSPNLLAVIAALTKALQEAMGRIEALEAAA